MNLKYHELPFGAQLLLWTSRLVFHGSCRTKPNKYDLVDIAYKKVGIHDGCNLLSKYLSFLKIHKKFTLQPICTQYLVESEINLIDCIDANKQEYFNNNYYIKIWDLHKSTESFTSSARNLAAVFKKANLNTKIEFLKKIKKEIRISYDICETLH